MVSALARFAFGGKGKMDNCSCKLLSGWLLHYYADTNEASKGVKSGLSCAIRHSHRKPGDSLDLLHARWYIWIQARCFYGS